MDFFSVKVVETGARETYRLEKVVSLFSLNRDILLIPEVRNITVRNSKYGTLLISREDNR